MMFNLNIKTEHELLDQIKLMSDVINHLQKKCNYFERIIEELKYVALSQGHLLNNYEK